MMLEKTRAVLEMVYDERRRQFAQHGDAMAELPNGTGPDVPWLLPIAGYDAADIQTAFRQDYQQHRGAENPTGQYGQLTRMHLVREELAEAFERAGDDPRLVPELLQVAALFVQWVEILTDDEPRCLHIYPDGMPCTLQDHSGVARARSDAWGCS